MKHAIMLLLLCNCREITRIKSDEADTMAKIAYRLNQEAGCDFIEVNDEYPDWTFQTDATICGRESCYAGITDLFTHVIQIMPKRELEKKKITDAYANTVLHELACHAFAGTIEHEAEGLCSAGMHEIPEKKLYEQAIAKINPSCMGKK